MSARALALALVGLASCGYGPPTELACADLAEVRCDKRASCSNGADVTRVYGDYPTCLARERLLCTLSFAAPGTGVTPLGVEECVIAFPSLSCADFFAVNLPAACAFTGPRAMGSACAVSAQCATGYCDGIRTSACGTCAPAPVAGAPCVSSFCGPRLQCVRDSQMCREIPTLGMPCDLSTLPCAIDLACEGNVNGQMGTCAQALDTPGAACGGTLGGCDPFIGLQCAGTTSIRTCAATQYAGDGAACGALPDGSNGGCSAGDCYDATGFVHPDELGVCKAAAVEGQPCDAVLGPQCLVPARCVSTGSGTAGTCALPAPAGCG